jgi:hypothetical protein
VEFEKINPTTIDFYLHTPLRAILCLMEHFTFWCLMCSQGRLSATTETADNSNRLTAGQAIKQRLHK